MEKLDQVPGRPAIAAESPYTLDGGKPILSTVFAQWRETAKVEVLTPSTARRSLKDGLVVDAVVNLGEEFVRLRHRWRGRRRISHRVYSRATRQAIPDGCGLCSDKMSDHDVKIALTLGALNGER